MRGDAVAASCSYSAAQASKTPVSKSAKPASIDVRGRIDRLETLVRSLISQESIELGSNGPGLKLVGQDDSGSTVKQLVSADVGRTEDLDYDEEESLSPAGGQKLSLDTRSTHWDAILHDVSFLLSLPTS